MSEPGISPERYSLGVVTDDADIFPEFRKHLGGEFRIFLATTESEILALVERDDIHAILFNLDAIGDGPSDGLEVLEEIRRIRDDVVVVAFTRSNQRPIPLKASQAGADEFFLFPINYEELKIVLSRAIEKRALELEGRRVVQQVENKAVFFGLVGVSPAMQKVYQAIEAVAATGASVVIRGESGVGKELVARAIVQCSERAAQPFVCLNCSALPESLMESELFGYEKGAFTGADSAKPGLIESAHSGTLFLDEITTLHPSLQSKLLRVLQERSVQRLGGRAAKRIDFRLITATNEDLEDCVRKGRFREDLYFRINVVPIAVPSLRDRQGDIALLADHFLRIYCASMKKPLKTLQPDALEVMEAYEWPGNVRELENVVQRVVVMVGSPVVRLENLPQQLLQHSATVQEAILIPEEGVDFDAEMERIEIAYLNAALRRTAGKKSAAAELLRLDGQRMKYLCRKHRV
ncbi:MAG TPA: sigma-54 dependent transcriptional regulator [Candidatus Acidoferrales bacterium]|nr:sigma-54 dependent transcriptional regulator [Candidatus Acidoferrales bacterium]